MSKNCETHFKNLAAFAVRFLKFDHFGKLCAKGLRPFQTFLMEYFTTIVNGHT